MLTDLAVVRRVAVLRCVSAYGSKMPSLTERNELRASLGEEAFAQRARAFHDKIWRPIRNTPVWSALSPAELVLANAEPATVADRLLINASWRSEALAALAWAVGLVPELPAWDQMAGSEVATLPSGGEIEKMAQRLHRRAEEEIAEARERAERWHWRSRTRDLEKQGIGVPWDAPIRAAAQSALARGWIHATVDGDLPACGKSYRALDEEEASSLASIASERHFALNWLCGYAPGAQWDDTPTET